VTLDGRAQSLLRPGRHPWRGGDLRRPPAGRRRLLLLAICTVALVVAPQAIADPTSTTPAPDPNPPPGAAPDPYTPAPKAPAPAPKTTPAPVHTVTRVYSPPAYSPPAQPAPVQQVTPRTVAPATPVRPTVVHHAARKAHKTRHRKRHHVVVHHKPKPIVVRLTPRAEAYATWVAKTMSTTVAAPTDAGLVRRRRAAGLALAALCAASLCMILVGRRGLRERLP
jgi:hypothetical protein